MKRIINVHKISRFKASIQLTKCCMCVCVCACVQIVFGIEYDHMIFWDKYSQLFSFMMHFSEDEMILNGFCVIQWEQ